MQPRRGIAALDDSSLLEILTRVGATDAKGLAKCRCVSRQWRELGWAVPHLAFRFDRMRNSDQLRKNEFILSSVLRDTRRAAPGCLKVLKVTLGVASKLARPLEILGHWLVYVADSVVDLELDLMVLGNGDEEPQWGPAVCTSLVCFQALKRLKIRGYYCRTHFLPHANEAPFKNLTSFHLWDSYANSELLEALCTACPALKDLSVVDSFDDIDVVRITSASLERLVLNMCGDVLTVFLRTPRLESLDIDAGRNDIMELSVASLESLSELRLVSSCRVCTEKQWDKVTRLHVDGIWKLHALASVLQLTPMVTDLTMGSSLLVIGTRIPIGQVFKPLPNLKTVDFYSLESIEADDTELVCKAVTVHVRVMNFWFTSPSQASEAPPIMKQLLNVYRVKKMVVHCCELSSGFLPLWQAVMVAFPTGQLIMKLKTF